MSGDELATCPECGNGIHVGFQLPDGSTEYPCPDSGCEGVCRPDE